MLRDRAIALWRDPAKRWRAGVLLAVAVAWGIALRVLFAPMFADLSRYGFRDWDHHSAFHYITVLALERYHELPWWHPWLCGGFPAWAYSEGATNLVSPYLPLYLALPIQVAERCEVLGATITALVTTYLLAGRFTRSAALRALVAVAFALNGRWVMQAAEGHMWHLQYAWVPLVLYFFDLSLERGKLRWAIYAGMTLALMVYMGGIYPAPHAVLALFVYAAVLTLSDRALRVRPAIALAITGVTAVGFAAPKLLPLVDLMSRYPRKVASTEAIDLGQMLATFLDKKGSMETPASVTMPEYGWYEYGIYVGVWVTLAMAIAVFGPSPRARGLAARAAGLVMLLLGFGAFHEYAPWTLLHKAPAFSSQHVPSRFVVMALLLLMIAFTSLVGPALDRVVASRRWIDLALLVPVALIATDIARVGRVSFGQIFVFKVPHVDESAQFHHVSDLAYHYDPDWHQIGRQMILSMYANTGVLRCYYLPPEVKAAAVAQGSPGYRGEAYVEGSTGTAKVVAWTPNTATIEYADAGPGARVVYNMNWDPSWRADGKPAKDDHGVVATDVPQGSGRVRFTYSPRTLPLGLLLFALTAFGAFGARPARRWWRARQSLRSKSSTPPNVPIE